MFLFFLSGHLYAQTIIKMPQVDIVGYYNSGYYHLYNKVADNKYYSIDLDFDSVFDRDKDSMSSTFSIKSGMMTSIHWMKLKMIMLLLLKKTNAMFKL